MPRTERESNRALIGTIAPDNCGFWCGGIESLAPGGALFSFRRFGQEMKSRTGKTEFLRHLIGFAQIRAIRVLQF
jgi:hypothetical protein